VEAYWLAFKGFIVHFSIIPRRRSPWPLVTVSPATTAFDAGQIGSAFFDHWRLPGRKMMTASGHRFMAARCHHGSDEQMFGAE
jgi:hypothetical protein